MDASERLELILKHTKNNIASFGRAIDNIPQTFYDIKSGKIKSFSPEVAEKIITKYPDIDFIWLTTGKGEMLNTKPVDDSDVIEDPIKKANRLKREKGKEGRETPFVEIEAFVLPSKGKARSRLNILFRLLL